jgi:hypothetical protein
MRYKIFKFFLFSMILCIQSALEAQKLSSSNFEYYVQNYKGNVRNVEIMFHEVSAKESYGLEEINFDNETLIRIEFKDGLCDRFFFERKKSTPYDYLDDFKEGKFPYILSQNEEKIPLRNGYEIDYGVITYGEPRGFKNMKFSYDGKKLKSIIFYGNLNLSDTSSHSGQYFNFYYDVNGNLVSKEVYERGRLRFKINYKYQDNNIFEKNVFKGDFEPSSVYGEKLMSVINTYFDYGRMYSEIDQGNSKAKLFTWYTLDNKNRVTFNQDRYYNRTYKYIDYKLIGIETEDLSIKSSFRRPVFSKLTYNQHGEINKIVIGSNETVKIWEYKYDINNNWIERKQFGYSSKLKEFSLEFIIVRNITYY